jgi:ribosomal protein S18 acetylase RimI-like enzyme
MTEIEIRAMKVRDYDAVIELWDAAYLPYNPKGRDSRERIAHEIKGGDVIFLVAESDGEIVGSLLGTSDGRKGWINRLAVHPDYQRKGAAKQLMHAVEKTFEERDILVIGCLIHDDNLPSRNFFESMGYDLDDRVLYYSKRKSKEV